MTTDEPTEELLAGLLHIAVDLAEKTGSLLLELRSNAGRTVSSKKNAQDLVTEADRAAENLIAGRVQSLRPGDGIVGEEGHRVNPGSAVQWVIDPLDGTTNYLHGSGPFAVSIGVEIAGRQMVGVVRSPLTDETFAAAPGQGATCNGIPITASAASDLASAVVGFDCSTDPTTRHHQAEIVGRLFTQVRDLRRVGCCAVTLCWVAAGRLDGFFVHDAGPWDISAGTAIAREAGAWAGSSIGDVVTPQETIAAAPGIAGALRASVAALTP